MARTKTAVSLETSIAKRNVRPRAPSRSAGVIRYAALVNAVEALLQDESPDDVGLYQIAERAGCPPASVYHFFPTKEAAFLALAERYLEGFAQLTREPIPAASLVSWQALLARDLRMGMDYYNDNPPASKLFLGGYGGLETRLADRQYVERAARSSYQRFGRIFYMPFLRDAEKKFHINIHLVDAILSISYANNGQVTEDYYDEALSASIAYCRTFLPERIELRDEFFEAIARGDEAILISEECDSSK